MGSKNLLTTAEVGKLLNLSVRTLEAWRLSYEVKHQGPPWKSLSPKCVRYDPDEVNAWIEEKNLVVRRLGRRVKKGVQVLPGQQPLFKNEDAEVVIAPGLKKCGDRFLVQRGKFWERLPADLNAWDAEVLDLVPKEHLPSGFVRRKPLKATTGQFLGGISPQEGNLRGGVEPDNRRGGW